MVDFHLQAGLADRSWTLFDELLSGFLFAPDYPVLPLNESDPSLRSLSGKTQDVQGRKIAQLGLWQWPLAASTILRVLVSVARMLLQDFWRTVLTVMAKDYLALIDPTGNPIPIVRQGTVVYLMPTVIPYAFADAPRLAASCLPWRSAAMQNSTVQYKQSRATKINHFPQ